MPTYGNDHRFATNPGANAGTRSFTLVPIDLAARPTEASFPGNESSSSTTTSSGNLQVTWKTLPRKFLRDEKDMWLFPGQLAKGRHWLPTALLVGGTAVLIKEDPRMERSVRQTSAFGTYNNVLSSTTSGAIIAGVPAAFYLGSLLTKNSYGQSTSLLAGEAVAHDAILMLVLKAITRRARPSEFPPNGLYNDTFFATHNSLFGKGSSFPSGHAMMSFSVATVFSQRYREHKWVPILAYTLASAISFSRITTGSHFVSDTFIGAGLGFAIARFDVLRGE